MMVVVLLAIVALIYVVTMVAFRCRVQSVKIDDPRILVRPGEPHDELRAIHCRDMKTANCRIRVAKPDIQIFLQNRHACGVRIAPVRYHVSAIARPVPHVPFDPCERPVILGQFVANLPLLVEARGLVGPR